MLRILKFIGAFLATLLVVVLLVFGFNFDPLLSLIENSDDLQEGSEWVAQASSLQGLTEYVAAHPGRVSILSTSLQNPDSTLAYGPHAPHTMGTLGNFFLLAEFARRAEAGELDPSHTVPLEAVERYQLPYMDATNHRNALRSLAEGEDIRSAEIGRRITLGALMQSAVQFNDLAASDWLWFRLAGEGGENLDALMARMGLSDTELPLPFSGLYTVLNPHLAGATWPAHLDSLGRMDRRTFTDSVIAAARRLHDDPAFRERVQDTFRRHEGMGIGFTQQRDALALFPKSTAAELAGLMEGLQRDSLLSSAVSRRIKSYMDWPLEGGRLTQDFSSYGALYDSRLGMANGMDYGSSAYTGEPFAQTVYFDPLQVAFWFHMSSNLMHQDFQQRLIWDPALRRATAQAILEAGSATAPTDTLNPEQP
ncbi:MAG: serine hydrolase [Balneolaceae bacterium]|nr:serine hydrolase [Balneolaceae bacterium]